MITRHDDDDDNCHNDSKYIYIYIYREREIFREALRPYGQQLLKSF